MTPEQFKEIFWAHFPPEVRALRPMIEDASHDPAKQGVVAAEAVRLAIAGFTLDPHIMIGPNIDPFTTISLRIADGYVWYPALFEEKNYDIAPNQTYGAPGWRPYNPKTPTKRFIPCSLNAEDWPAFDPPVTNEVLPGVPAKPDFSLAQGSGRYGCLIGDRSPAGMIYEGAEGKFIKRAVPTIAAVSVFWEEVQS